MSSSTPPIIEEAIKRFNLVVEAESKLREECLDDLKFSIGDQWPTTIKGQREKDGRPCLTLDKMQQSTRLVCNEYRQQRPAIQVNPIGDGADVDTAEILQGLVRHVEVNSDAEIAYDGAHEFVVRIGFGSWRILSDYTDDESDEQEIFIRKIRNPFTVYWQPGVEQEDAEWCFITADIPRETYKANYPDSMASADGFTSTGANAPDWITDDYIRVAEYFTIKKVKGKGKRDKREVKWHLINAVEELETEKDVPGTQIPVLTAYGDDLDINGDRFVAGLIRNGKDPQRMNNYWNSAATEAIALAPKAPWVVVAGQLQNFETAWEQSNVKNTAVLTYNPIDVQGKAAPPPQRNTTEPPIQAMAHMLDQSAADLKSALGLYDPSLGQKKGNESGLAIGKLQQQGDVATLNFSDNMARAMRRCGRILLQWIRAVYDTPRVARIINPDGSVNQVVIHNGAEQADAAQQLASEDADGEESKIKKIYDIGVGRYDVAIAVGPSFQSKRQQASALQLELLKMLPPELVTSFMDIVVANMDIPQAKELAERAKKMLPPQLQGDDSDPQSQISKLQAQLQQMGQQGQLLSQKLQEAMQTIQTKQVEQQAKTEQVLIQEQNAFGIAKLKADTEIAVAEINTKAQQLQERISALQELHSDLHEAAHEKAMADEQHQHEQSMATQQQGADAQSQQVDAANSQSSQQSDQAHQQTMAQQAAEQQGADNE